MSLLILSLGKTFERAPDAAVSALFWVRQLQIFGILGASALIKEKVTVFWLLSGTR